MSVTDDVRAPQPHGGERAQRSSGDGGFERTPPQDIAAEQCVLGGMLLSKDAIADVVEILRTIDFYRPAHATIFDAILDLYGRGEPADPITVAAALADSGALARIGGVPYLHDLVAIVPTAANASYYGRIVAERAVLRRLVEAGTRIVQLGYGAAGGGGRDVDDTVDLAQQEIYNVTEKRVSEDFAVLAELLQPTLDEIEAVGAQGGLMTGVPTGFTDLDRLLNGLHSGQLIIVAGRPGLGKCLSGDTLITESGSGRRLTIAEFVRRGRCGEPLGVHTLTGHWRLQAVRPSQFLPNGRRPVLRLTTSSGRTIRATPNHPFRVLTGWRPLAELRVGDHIAAPRMVPVTWTPTRFPDALVALTAYLIGDDAVGTRAPRLRIANKAIKEDATQHAGRLGISARVRHPAELTFVVASGRSNQLDAHLAAVGLAACGEGDRHIPDAYLSLGARQLRIFLSRLYAADGWARTSRQPDKPAVEVGYATTSERLARDLQHLLLRLGLCADIARREVGSQGATRWCWQVLLHRPEQVEWFCREVGIVGQQVQVRSVLAECERRVRHGESDPLPPAVWHTILAERGELTWAEINERCGRPLDHDWQVGRAGISRNRLAELAKAIDSPVLRDLAESDVVWDRVESIEPDGETDVYDLTVAGTSNFVADGFVVHNSTAGMDFARAASVRNNLASAIFSLEMSKVEIVMRLLSAEARVPLHVLRSGQLSDDDWTKLARRMGEISEAPLFVDDTPNMTLMEIRAKSRRLKQRNDLKLIIVDYLQLMTSPKRTESRQQEVAELSRGLKLLAKEVECPVVAVSQLNRGPEQRTDKRPQLADLRESGCMTADTTILRADTGAPVTFRQLMDEGWGGVTVWSLDERRRLVAAPLTKVFSSGVKEVFRLTLASGRTVKASDNHPFLTPLGWLSLDRLAVGGRVAVPRRLPPPIAAGLGWGERRLGLLGHLLANGCVVARQPVRYASRDPEHLAFVERAAAMEFGITSRRASVRDTERTHLTSPHRLTQRRRNPISQWFDDLGIADLHSHETRLPVALYAANDGEIRIFLRHLWAAGGSVTVPSGGSAATAPTISYSTSSRALADGIVHLLVRLGLGARMYPVRHAGTEKAGYHVVVAGARDIRRFCAEVGVPGAAGTAVADHLASRADRVTDDTDSLHDPSTNDVCWDMIIGIEPLGSQPVFDATVKGTHNFIADGIVAHNSIEQDADVVILLHRDDYYDKESPRAGEADFIVAKHRNGPTDTITVAAQLHLSRFVDMAVV